MPTIHPFSLRLVPVQEAAQTRLISAKTPFTLNTGLAMQRQAHQRWLLNLQAWPARASVAPQGGALNHQAKIP